MLYANAIHLLYASRIATLRVLPQLSTPDRMQRDEVTQHIITSAQHHIITNARPHNTPTIPVERQARPVTSDRKGKSFFHKSKSGWGVGQTKFIPLGVGSV